MRKGVVFWVGALALGCADDASSTDGPGGTASPGSSSAATMTDGPTSAAASGSSDGAGPDGTGPDPDGGATGTTSDTQADTGTPDDSGTGGELGKSCALEVIDAAADPAAVIDMGDAAGQIPTVIGDALLRNCGCHYTDDAPGYTDYISNAAPMSTWDDFHTNFEGVFPAGFGEQLTWEACEVRVVFQQPLPMPPNDCSVEGEAGFITHDDFVLFAQWFEAGAPDGANFP